MAQAGTILVGGDAGESLGDSLYEAVIYVGGKIRSLGADAQVEELTSEDVARVTELVAPGGLLAPVAGGREARSPRRGICTTSTP